MAKAYANLLHQLFDENGSASFPPRLFKNTIGRYGPSFSGYGQQDSQEFLLFLLDGLQEDLNRIQKKPYIEKPDSTDEMVHNKAALRNFADRCWEIYKARNDSVITDLFAGMYKSTVVCPDCDKVSIIFDPYSNLTLQLPIDNLWSKQILFFPLHSKPIFVDVDIDKNASIKSLKEYVGKRVKVDPQRLIMAEIFREKFYKVFDNMTSIGDSQITDSDEIAIYELDSVPTSFNPDKQKRMGYGYTSLLNPEDEVPDFDSPKADRMLIRIYNRRHTPHSRYRYPQRPLFGLPMFTVITREEAFDYDAVLRKILARVATMTNRDILHEDEPDMAKCNSAEDSDTIVTNEEDIQSSDPRVKASSVEGEDGLVDVSMRDVNETSSQDENSKESKTSLPHVLRPGSFIPPTLRNMCDVKILKPKEGGPISGQCNIDESKEYNLMLSRVTSKAVNAPARRKKNANVFRPSENSPVSSEDELNDPAPAVPFSRTGAAGNLSNHSSSAETRDDSDSGTGSDVPPSTVNMRRNEKLSKRKTSRLHKRPPVKLPYVRPGETIVLDWNEEMYDAVFGANSQDEDPLRGSPTWDQIDCLSDPELVAKRQLRQSKRRRGVTLGECLDEFGREEVLSENDAWYCPRCKEHRRATKKFELWKSPDILVMHLKRFSANRIFRDKIDAHVDFPLELDMSGRIQMPEEGESLMYDLIAVDNHYGGLGGGHYTAFAKNFVDGNWYEYNGELLQY